MRPVGGGKVMMTNDFGETAKFRMRRSHCDIKAAEALPPQQLVAVQVTGRGVERKHTARRRRTDDGAALPIAIGSKIRDRRNCCASGQTRFGWARDVGCGALTKKGSTQVFVMPEQLEILTVMLCMPAPTIVPAGGDWVMLIPPQVFRMHGELDRTERLGTTAWHALVVSKPRILSCRQPQFTVNAPPLVVPRTVWLQFVALPHRSVSVQVRTALIGQRVLVTVLATETVTLLPLQRSTPIGAGSKFQGAPQATFSRAHSCRARPPETSS